MKISLVFSQFGPYHCARATALRNAIGGENFIAVQLAAQSKTYAWKNSQGHHNDLVTLCKGAEEDLSFLRVFFVAFKFWRREKIGAALLPSYSPASSLALLLSAKLAGVKCIMMNESHAGTERARGIKRRIKKYLVSFFNAALVGGEPQKRHFTALGLAPEKIFTGYDAIDNTFFSSEAARARAASPELAKRLGLPQRYFLSLGRFVKKKDLPTLIRAYAAFCINSSEPVALVMVGSGTEEDELRELTSDLGLQICSPEPARSVDLRPQEGAVYFMGFRQVEENPSFYALAEAFVLPSVEEEWGLVVNEAMACGLPVLVSNAVGCAEDLVVEGANGWLFNPGDTDALATRLKTLAENKIMRKAMGEESRVKVTHWDCANFAKNALQAVEVTR